APRVRGPSEGESGYRARGGVTSSGATRSGRGERHVRRGAGGAGLRKRGSSRGWAVGLSCYWGVGGHLGLGRESEASSWSCGCRAVFWGLRGAGKGVGKRGSHEARGARACCAGYCPGTREKGPAVSVPGGAVLLPFVPLSQTVAVPLPPTLVLGAAAESGSEPETGGSAAGTPATGLKVPGEASETEEEEEEDSAARVPLPGVSRGAPRCCSSGWGRARGGCGAR
ncbi:uncharacterized protein LOC116241495, partial [Phasianus colchicus]|uniref:uncharacterized protein LOC116241495 n=1 Tax=Phasianus colchicus TaxID=9054 RepID=UPI00129D902C